MANFPVSFELEIKNDAEIKKKFEDLVKALEDTKKAAEDANKPVDDTAKALDDLSKSAGDVDKDLDDTAKSLDDVSKSAGDISSDLKDANSAFEDIADTADTSAKSMDAVGTSFGEVSTSAVEADQNIREAANAIGEVDSATGNASSGLDAVGTSFDNVSTSAQEAQTNIAAAEQGIEGIGTSTGQATTALDGLGSAFDGAGTSTTTFNDVLSSTGTQAQTASGGLTPLNTVLGQTGTSAQTAQTGFQGFNANLATMTGFLGIAASGALSFVTALSNLHGAQIKLESAQSKLSTANEAVAKAQAKLNELYSSGSASAQEIEQATLDLQQAQDKQGIATDKVGKAQDDLNIKYAKFATDTLPNLIQTVTGTIAVLGTMKTAISGISFAPMATSIMTVAVPALAALYTAIGVLESVPALTKAISAAVEKDMDGMMTNLDEFLGVLERFASVLPGLGGAPLKLMREELDKVAKSQGIATKEVDASIPSLLDADTHAKNLGEAYQILVGGTNNLGESTQKVVEPTKQEAAAIAGIKGEIETARAGIDGFTGSQEDLTESSYSLTVAMQEGNEAMAENIRQTMDLVGSQENADNAILKLQQSYADHKVAIDQLNTSLNTAEGQLASYHNAVAAGDEQFMKWVQSTRDAATQAETFETNLAGMVNTFQSFPQWMEPTIENMQAFIRANTEGGEAAKEFARLSLESYRGLVAAAEPLFNDLKQAVQDVMEGKFIESQDIEGALINPIQAAFDKLPPLVQASLDETERAALTFQAEFANIGEQAGTAWATNLQANISKGFPEALAAANQAALDIIAPFVQQHPETAQMIQPLITALQEGTPEGVRQALESLAGMQGPFQAQAQGMLTEWNTMTGQLGPSLKTGVEGGLADLTQIMSQGMNTIVEKLNTLINTGIKQDPASVPIITANTNPANEAIQLIGTSLDQLKTYLETNPVSITVDTGAAGIAIQEIQQQIDQVHGTNVYITVDTSGAQAAIQQLQQQINSLQQSMGGIGGGYTPGYQSPYGSYQGAYGSPYGYAQGFGPAVVNRPTRMLVGEAGPEFVSVIPMKGRNQKNPPRSITAAAGMGQFPGQLWQSDAEEEAYKREVQAAMQQGSQQGSTQGTQQGFDQGMPGMQQAVQQGAQQGVQEGMAQGYQQAPSNTELFGTGSRFTWGGGAAGTQLGGGPGGGAQYPMAPSDTSLFGTGTRFTWRGGASGTSLGGAMGGGGGFGGAIPPNFWTGTGGGSRLVSNPGGTPAPANTGFQVPASYGKPLGQLINGIAATILPGQGPIRQAALGMHERLKKDTMIQAHANERVDISSGNDHPGRSSGIDQASLDKIISLLERQLTQATTYKVDFNVDGHKLSSVAAKNMGTAGYGDK